MRGLIIVNPFLIPKESIFQAERLKEEFDKLNIEVEIISDCFLRSEINSGEIKTYIKNVDFAIYLDKDKYQSKILTDLGIRLFNSHDAIRVCDDKGETYLALINKGINLPETIFAPLCYNKDLKVNREYAKIVGEKLNYPLIVKQSFGSMGKGVYKAENLEELISIMEKVKLTPHLYQKYLGKKKGVDIRLIVIGKKVVAVMERKNQNDFRSNVAQGGTGKATKVPESFILTAEKVADILNLDYCGVDLLYGDNDEPYVCEVNSNAFISGIEKATNINVCKLYCEYIVREMKK